MDWLRRGLTQFRTVSARDKVPVLLCSRSVLDLLVPGEFDSIPDEVSLAQQVQIISKKIGTLWLDKWLATISDIVSGASITPAGFSGRISFPIFPFRTANNQIIRRIQYVDRDKLNPKTFARFFGLFKKLPDSLRPRVLFVGENRTENAHFFDDIADLVDLYEVFPERLSRVQLQTVSDGKKDYFDYLGSGSFAAASNQSLEFPAANEDASVIRQHVIKNYHICMAQQHDSAAFSIPASANIGNLLRNIDQYLLYSEKKNTEFLISAKIQSLLLKILIDDDDSDSLYQAISLSKAVENLAYEQKCLRFSNQIAGVSSYALECLRQSADAISEICQHEPYNQLQRLEYFAVMQNIFITRLFNRKNLIDVGEAVTCLQFAEDQYRYFDELAMLANSVGLSFLAIGNTNGAEEYFRLASTYSADRLTHLNIRINHLISRYLSGEVPANEVISVIFEEYRTLPFGDESAYHATMAFGNLWRLAQDKNLKRKITRAAIERRFIHRDQDGSAIIPALKSRGFLFMKTASFTGAFGSLIEHSGFMPAFHFNWSTPVAEASPR
jgi:hypothetical protein